MFRDVADGAIDLRETTVGEADTSLIHDNSVALGQSRKQVQLPAEEVLSVSLSWRRSKPSKLCQNFAIAPAARPIASWNGHRNNGKETRFAEKLPNQCSEAPDLVKQSMETAIESRYPEAPNVAKASQDAKSPLLVTLKELCQRYHNSQYLRKAHVRVRGVLLLRCRQHLVKHHTNRYKKRDIHADF